MKIVFEQPVVNVVELATGPKGDAGPASTIPGPPNTLTAGTITQIPAGGQPTVSITGTAPSQTLNLGLVDGSPTAFELRGEGFPGTGTNATSTDAAAVGTYYTDTLGTTGAWRWLKTSAGTGNARWTVAFGDTGWRDISSVLTADFEPSGGVGLRVRRVNALISLRLRVSVKAGSPLIGGSATLATTLVASMPGGWSLPEVWSNAISGAWGPSPLAMIGNGSSWPVLLIRGATAGSIAAGSIASGSGTYDPGTPWPTTLPGTPA